MSDIVKENSKSLEEKDKKNIWHHITPYTENHSPLIAYEGQGSWITDHHGHKYLDGMSGLWCVNVGYGREELAIAAYEQLKKMAYFPMTQSHVPAIELAEKLNKYLDDDYVFFYGNSGSDANEVAFKLVRQYHAEKGTPSKYKFISRYRAYHGSSMGALSATGQALRKYKYEPLSSGFLHVAPPDNFRRPKELSVEEYNLKCAEELEQKIIWEQKETIAGLIMEPIITGGGMLIPHKCYVEKVYEICQKHDVLLIMDEVICGFGRTGKMFGFMHYGIKPDIITMAKGITSAYLPLSVTAVRKEIYEAFKSSNETSHFRHINTFGGNPAACALAIKNIEIMEKENLVARSAVLGDKLYKGLQELENHPHVGDIRHKGFLMGIEIVEHKETKEPANPTRVSKIIKECRDLGLIIGKNGDTVAGFNNILTICPPLSSTDEDLNFIVNVLKKVFQANS
ncbi:aspartate aminotransferase family protein [Robertmurraya sp. DFI.2.37]|uniref:aspartate aminotransferase family protein n=1 Tax=Robertmurraya sp. DFI.2.37 TaxID=3031819 RepID=UPI001245A77C|nr:aspartate aminotransferase family protein [Robertmurraya sp. DFI.2.37]MDF1508801.1 aspartate aminotransferase family protein [Robertmurraya sp. DFI.2.37]